MNFLEKLNVIFSINESERMFPSKPPKKSTCKRCSAPYGPDDVKCKNLVDDEECGYRFPVKPGRPGVVGDRQHTGPRAGGGKQVFRKGIP